ncbi:MAG: hypothetical protein JXR83_14945 [Deltaproteobacteria bacterium]|nr:hypothetical protein [Deltaproteobacteria bacterium]
MARLSCSALFLFSAGAGCALIAAGCSYKVVEDGRVNREAVRQLVETVAEIRGLPQTRPLKVALESPALLRQRAERDARDQRRSADLDRQRLVWGKLGLIDVTADLVDAYGKLTSEAPYGYYDTGDQVLRIVARPLMRSEVLELVSALRGRDVVAGEILSHEVCHALQDMAYDLDRLHAEAPDDDARLALQALVEGDAGLVSFLYAASFFQDYESWVEFLRRRVAHAFAVAGVPDYLNARLQFPYLAGGLFVAALYRSGRFAAIDETYRQLPLSTELILHPEIRATAAAAPVAVALPPWPETAGEVVLGEDTLGEFGLRTMFARNAPGIDAAQAAAGWGGDRYRVVQQADGTLGLQWATRWDSVHDARQFCDAYRAMTRRGDRDLIEAVSGTSFHYRAGRDLRVVIDCAGDAVDVAETMGDPRTAELLQQMAAARAMPRSAPGTRPRTMPETLP